MVKIIARLLSLKEGIGAEMSDFLKAMKDMMWLIDPYDGSVYFVKKGDAMAFPINYFDLAEYMNSDNEETEGK